MRGLRFAMLRTLRAMVAAPMRKRQAHWKAAAPSPLAGSQTFAAQSSLPALPVPNLKSTLAELKETLKPLAWSEDEYRSTTTKIDDFEAGLAPTLQDRLVARAKDREHWLEEWWDDLGYLTYRDSVVINVSYYYGFNQHPKHLRQTPAARAAALARGAMIFRQKFRQGLIAPEKTKEGPLCMDTYRWMFDCCRIPGIEGKDWSISYAKEGDLGDSGHIVVFRRNRPWLVEATRNGQILSTEEFERQIQHIYDNSSEDYTGVGVLTASNRDDWAKNYESLASSTHNASILDSIQSAAFTISLDCASPKDNVEHSRYLWHGDATEGKAAGLQNRWVDKPVQFIVFDNAEAGLMGEHSVMDGTPTARLCDEVLDWLNDPSFDHGTGTFAVEPTPLDWKITPELTQAVEVADQAARDLIGSQELTFYETSYGKEAVKKFGVSPDSWAQMIIQLAYRRLLGSDKRQGATYEAATTRKFLKGRTEAIRVVTSESDDWVQSMDDPSATPAERKQKFDLATRRHVQVAKRGGSGQGIDRHIFGLKLLVEPNEEAPALFSDPLFKRSSYWVLSTSAVFSKHFDVYGWGEVVPDGFGVPYMTGHDGKLQSSMSLKDMLTGSTDRLVYTLTSRKEMPNEKFQKEIARAADELFQLHSGLASKEKAKL